MKSKINLLGLGILVLMLSSFSFSMNENLNSKEDDRIISSSGERYRVTAQTRNLYGQNYWVDLIVEGVVATWGNTIYGVYYDDGYGLKKLTYYVDFGYQNSYFVTIDYKSYYFTF